MMASELIGVLKELAEVADEATARPAKAILSQLEDAESGATFYAAAETFYRSDELGWLDGASARHFAFARWMTVPDHAKRVWRLFARMRREDRRRELQMIRRMVDAELANLDAARKVGTFTVEATLHVPWSGEPFLDWTRMTRPTQYRP
jgi:hypothetical protein